MLTSAPGNPGVLVSQVENIAHVSEAVAAASRILREAAIVGEGRAIDALRGTVMGVSDTLDKASDRHHRATIALRHYAVDLAHVHARADAAIAAHAEARQRVDLAGGEVAAAMAAQDENAVTRALAHLHHARHAMEQAHANHGRALAFLDEAAEEAIRAIGNAIDSARDAVSEAVGAARSLAGAASEWATGAFSAAISNVRRAAAPYFTSVATLLTTVACATMIPVIFRSAMIADLWDALAVSDWTRFQMVAAAAGIAMPLLGAFVVNRMKADVLKPTPEVSTWQGPETDLQRRASHALGTLAPGRASDLMTVAGLVDIAGGSERTVVDIARVTGPHGEEHWIVTLPSTQDWVIPQGDQGAVNDLDANMALMLLPPQVPTQVERGVLEAMRLAGVEEGASVMFVGFSQGGILAARLASTQAHRFDVGGVLAAGAPIDLFPIDAQVPVVSMQHRWDPVHYLDLVAHAPSAGNRVTWWDHVPGLPAHSISAYTDSVARADAEGAISGMFAPYLVTADKAAAGWSYTREQYQFSEGARG